MPLQRLLGGWSIARDLSHVDNGQSSLTQAGLIRRLTPYTGALVSATCASRRALLVFGRAAWIQQTLLRGFTLLSYIAFGASLAKGHWLMPLSL